jgi:hypothetical protein
MKEQDFVRRPSRFSSALLSNSLFARHPYDLSFAMPAMGDDLPNEVKKQMRERRLALPHLLNGGAGI